VDMDSVYGGLFQ